MRTYFRVKGGHLEEVKGEVVREQIRRCARVATPGERDACCRCQPETEPLLRGNRLEEMRLAERLDREPGSCRDEREPERSGAVTP
jgi:hypothetical protein